MVDDQTIADLQEQIKELKAENARLQNLRGEKKKLLTPTEAAICRGLGVPSNYGRAIYALYKGESHVLGWSKNMFRQYVYNIRRRFGSDAVITVATHYPEHRNGVEIEGYALSQQFRDILDMVIS